MAEKTAPWSKEVPTACLVLADGTVIRGRGLGATRSAVGALTTIEPPPEMVTRSVCGAAGLVSLPTPKTTPVPALSMVSVLPVANSVLW